MTKAAGTAKKYGWNLDHSYAKLPESFFSRLDPIAVSAPQLVLFNEPLALSLGLDAEALQSEEGAAIFAGNALPEAALPLAQAYAGHQFGHFTMLGDGRAVLIGEQITPAGERWDIQLKGSGRTPYSRGGDGRAALGPMLREYLISEAMHGLGIPTSRSLAVVRTGEPVFRENALPGAVLTRVAQSHLRVGTFEYVANWGTTDELQTLADYALHRHFPSPNTGGNHYLSLLQNVIERQASLVAQWQLIGFIHGVMNTDNMTISGESIDYGPCAFMNEYDPATVFSSIDTFSRYAYGNQPRIAAWNLARFAETLLPLLHEQEQEAIAMAEASLADYSKFYHAKWLEGMRAKLGLFRPEADDVSLIEKLLGLLEEHKADYTNTFRALTLNRPDETTVQAVPGFQQWYDNWQARLGRQPETTAQSQQLMQRNNPAVIPRNHRVEEALEASVMKGDCTVLNRLLRVLANPYAYSPEQEEFAAPPPPSDTPYRTYCGT